MTIRISDDKKSYDFYEVPRKVAKAVITLLVECASWEDSEIVAAESDVASQIPCDLCKYNPPSSMDGKPCSMCPAEGRG